MIPTDQLRRATGLDVFEASVTEAGGVTWFLARRRGEKHVGTVGRGGVEGEKVGSIDARPVVLAPADAGNAAVLREALPWTAPRRIGLATSVGLGDRLGLATPGHIRAVRGTGLQAVLAQQSIREMTRTGRSPRNVIDDATWGVFQEGFSDGFGCDADHLQSDEDIRATAAAGFVSFTIDPGARVEDRADAMDAEALRAHYELLAFDALGRTPEGLLGDYADKTFDLAGGGRVAFSAETLYRAAVKYGGAVAHVVGMHRVLTGLRGDDFDLEVSVDETATPTTPAEHYFIAAELKRCGIEPVALAPRFVGRFEKGVDYLGDLDAFGESFARHVAVMRTLGPYKISIHSGSDKFSIYPVVAERTGGLVHVKTAGTSYLEALRVIARLAPGLFREVLDFAREHYEADRATYHVSAELSRVPAAADVPDDALADLLDDFHARQVLHVTYGSVLTADEGQRFAPRVRAALCENEEAYSAALAHHLGRHVAPFAK